MLQEVSVLRIRVRKWIRSKLQASIKAGPRDLGVLDKMPWLESLLPLGSYLRADGFNQITFQKVDRDLLFKDFAFSGVYLVAADGTVLLKARGIITTGWCGTIRKAEPIHQAFWRLGGRANRVHHVVVIDSVAVLLTPGSAMITIYNFPRNESAALYVARLVEEERIATAQKDREEIEKEVASYEAGREATPLS
jgi:hypothetical protein